MDPTTAIEAEVAGQRLLRLPAVGVVQLVSIYVSGRDAVDAEVQLREVGFRLATTAVPEPGTLVLAAIGAIALAVVARRRGNRTAGGAASPTQGSAATTLTPSAVRPRRCAKVAVAGML